MFEGRTMGTSQHNSRGFTLIAALLLTILLSGVAVGLMFMVSNEVRMGGNDLEGNQAYYAAEAQIENLTSELSQLYQSSQSPTAASINALANSSNWANAVSGSNISNITYASSTPMISWPTTQPNGTACANGNPCGGWDIVGSGSNQGMVATLIPFTLNVTATRQAGAGQESTDTSAATGASVQLTRTVEVALLPAFEFGVFCDGDCDYFAGPPFNFGGRVHANGNLFLAANTGPLTFTDKLTAVSQVIISQLENGTAAGPSAGSYNGAVYVPTAAGACPNAPGSGPATNCVALPAGSWSGGFPPTGAANAGWTGISKSTFNGFIENGLTGASKLQLPFVNSSPLGAVDIIRKPRTTDSTLLASSRLYNEASIRILLADTEGDLYPNETRSDSATQDIQIGTPFTDNGGNGYIDIPFVETGNGVTAGNMYFATAAKGSGNWLSAPPTGCSATLTSWPLFGEVTTGTPCQGTWLRVEYLNASGVWTGITTQWLAYGFGRNYNMAPTHPYNTSTSTAQYCVNFSTTTAPTGPCQNGISPAILILQQLQSSKTPANATGAATTANNWIPINFYDAREGEPRDTRPSGDPMTDCSPVGIMNAVELDVGNLWLWLQGSAPYSGGSGTSVSASQYNGYILYFADHRGMIQDAHPFTTVTFPNGFSGMSGLSDVVNSGSAVGVPDNKLEAITYYATATPTPYSPEDTAIKGNGFVDNWGEKNLGAGFGLATAAMAEPYYIYGSVTNNAIQCIASGSGTATAEWNMVTGPRHVLRLVDGGMDGSGNSFVPPTNGNATNNGTGFTVASEEPVYVWGNYNTGPSDPFWPSENTTTTPHSAAAIIADAVTLLSNPPTKSGSTVEPGWTDWESFTYPALSGSRPGNTSYYRMAIAAGKSVPFPEPAFGVAAGWPDFGTDGGMHNFLRYLEDRGANSSVVNYAGSLISMYYSQYATGIFKCCNAVYGAPTRNYFFDTQFLNPANLPPGTPTFQDVVSLSYHQSFARQ